MRVIDSLPDTDFCFFFRQGCRHRHGRSTYKPRICSGEENGNINIGLVILHAFALGAGVLSEQIIIHFLRWCPEDLEVSGASVARWTGPHGADAELGLRGGWWTVCIPKKAPRITYCLVVGRGTGESLLVDGSLGALDGRIKQAGGLGWWERSNFKLKCEG